ncbi:MAG: multicopper oxidase family protein [Actinomycetota bacterium]|nr:multicopper oxidase family protein [Actinomycetota bacterium]
MPRFGGLSRRAFLLGTGGGMLTMGALAACGTRGSSIVGPGSSQVADFAAAQRRPGAPVRDARLTALAETVDLGGVRADTWTYGSGHAVGPLLRGNVGDQLRVQVVNQLPANPPTEGGGTTTVHWHGLAIRNDMDGVPDVTQPAIEVGATGSYELTLPHPGTYLYHSHVGVQRDRGLVGPLIIDDPNDAARYDVEFIVVLDDWIDGINGATPDSTLADLRRTGMRMGGMSGMSGMGGMHDMGGMSGSTSAVGADGGDVSYPHYLINGRVAAAPETLVARPGQRARLRLINGAADTAFRIALADHQLEVTHTDGFPIAPTVVDTVVLGSGERYDALVTLGDGIFPLVASAEGKQGAARALVRTNSAASAPPSSAMPDQLRGKLLAYSELRADSAVALPSRKPDRTHRLALTADMARYVWMINGKTFGQHEPLTVRQGERVRLVMSNQTMMYHPMHLHGHTFALSDDNHPDGARKDTVIVLPMQTVTVDFDADNPGQWLVHCHQGYHEASGMMTVVSYQS